MRSTLEDFHEKLMKKGLMGSNDELKKLDSIINFLKRDEKLNNQIMNNATETIKTIQPSILFGDFKIAMSMIYAIVSNVIHYLVENGHLEIKDKVVK